MKAKLFFLIPILFVFVLSLEAKKKVKEIEVIKGSSLSELGDYTITPTDDLLVFNGKEVKTYELIYDAAKNPVYIGIDRVKRCMSFVIKTKALMIEYQCVDHVFGSCKVKDIYCEKGTENDRSVLDKRQVFSQRVITQNPKTESELLGLVACYFPDLISAECRKQI